MTEAAGVTDLMNAPAPAAAAPSATPTWRPSGYPTTPAEYNQPVAIEARAKIDELKADKDFYNRLQQKDPAAHQEWSRLHSVGFPQPQSITSQADVDAQAVARNEERWSGYIQTLKAQWPVTAEHEAEIRGGVVREDFHKWALEERKRLIEDASFRERLLVKKERGAREQWGRVVGIIGLRPVKAEYFA